MRQLSVVGINSSRHGATMSIRLHRKRFPRPGLSEPGGM